MDWKRRRWGKTIGKYGRQKGRSRAAARGNSGINLLVQRFRRDDVFRNAVMKGNYRYANGVLMPVSNNPPKIIIVGSVQKYGPKRGIDLPPLWIPTEGHKIYRRSSGYVRRGYGYGSPYYRIDSRPHTSAECIEDKHRSTGHTILLTPIAVSSGSVEGLLNLILFKSFGATLTAAMQYLGVTIEGLAFESHIDDRKIVRLRNDYLQSVYREDVLAIVIGLHLPPPIGEVFFQNAKIYLGYHDHQDVVYHMILGTMSQSSVDEVNAELRNAGLKEIPRGARRRACGIYLE